MPEVRRDSRLASSDDARAELAGGPDGQARLDLAETDARPQNPLIAEGQLIVARRDGTLDSTRLTELLERLPAVVVLARAYERIPGAPATA